MVTERFPAKVVRKWVAMAFISGSVNAGGLMACDRFVTHVTGFATLAGMESGNRQFRLAAGMLSVPLYFVLGVMIASFFTDAAILNGRKPQFKGLMYFAALLLAGAGLLGHLGYFTAFESPFQLRADYPLLIMLCAASGLQNAVLTSASGGIVRATHLTGTTTDVGMGLVRALTSRHRPEIYTKEMHRVVVRFATILGFIIGGLIGGTVFHYTQYLGFLMPAALAVYVGTSGFGQVPGIAPIQVAQVVPTSSAGGIGANQATSEQAGRV